MLGEPGMSGHLRDWQRPPTGDSLSAADAATGVAEGVRYAGPPPMTAPPMGWQPPHIVEPAPPRPLPTQDHAAIDEEEARARTITRAIAIVTGVVLALLACALCGRVVLS